MSIETDTGGPPAALDRPAGSAARPSMISRPNESDMASEDASDQPRTFTGDGELRKSRGDPIEDPTFHKVDADSIATEERCFDSWNWSVRQAATGMDEAMALAMIPSAINRKIANPPLNSWESVVIDA